MKKSIFKFKQVYGKMSKNINNLICDFCDCNTKKIRIDKGVIINGIEDKKALQSICERCYCLETC